MVPLFSRTNQYVMYVFEVHIIYEGLFFSEINQQHNTTSRKQAASMAMASRRGPHGSYRLCLKYTGNIHLVHLCL